MAQRDHRGMTTVRAPVFRLEPLNLTVPWKLLDAANSRYHHRRRLWGMTSGSRRQGGVPASLSRPMSSLALIASYRRRLALGLTCHTGLSLLFEVGVRPPHDGIRRMGRPNLWGALAAG
jgi:hypothetical protein